MPAEYVNKLARMFQDVKVSEDLNQEFKERHRGSQVAGGRRRDVVGGWWGCHTLLLSLPRYGEPKGPECRGVVTELRAGPGLPPYRGTKFSTQ